MKSKSKELCCSKEIIECNHGCRCKTGPKCIAYYQANPKEECPTCRVRFYFHLDQFCHSLCFHLVETNPRDQFAFSGCRAIESVRLVCVQKFNYFLHIRHHFHVFFWLFHQSIDHIKWLLRQSTTFLPLYKLYTSCQQNRRYRMFGVCWRTNWEYISEAQSRDNVTDPKEDAGNPNPDHL